MKEITVKSTLSGTKKAIAALKRADNDAGYAKDLKARLIAAPRERTICLTRCV